MLLRSDAVLPACKGCLDIGLAAAKVQRRLFVACARLSVCCRCALLRINQQVDWDSQQEKLPDGPANLLLTCRSTEAVTDLQTAVR